MGAREKGAPLAALAPLLGVARLLDDGAVVGLFLNHPCDLSPSDAVKRLR
jgi:hypothetical protein